MNDWALSERVLSCVEAVFPRAHVKYAYFAPTVESLLFYTAVALFVWRFLPCFSSLFIRGAGLSFPLPSCA